MSQEHNNKLLLDDPRLHALTEREVAAYRTDLIKKEPPISPLTAAKFFELFLNGKSCEEIQRLNPGFKLGQIVRARIDHEWDLRRQEHLDHLLDTVRQRVQQITVESVDFASDLLAAFNRLHGDKIKKFLQSGDPADLGELRNLSLKQYKEAVELLLKLTGQDQKKKFEGEVVHRHVSQDSVPQAAKPLSANEAAEIIRSRLKR